VDDLVDTNQVLAQLASPAARLVTGRGTPGALAACDVVIRSPGVSIYRQELIELRALGVPVTTATALWLAETGGRRVIGVTGTKGKSTTATLIHHLAVAAGEAAHLAGNIGSPALDLLDEPPSDLAVIELSSYQIADLDQGPEVAVVTNLYSEHIDWHLSDEVYRADKLRILSLPGVRATALNRRDPALMAASAKATNPSFFGDPGSWDVSPLGITHAGALVVPSSSFQLRGEHNGLNLCAAITALDLACVSVRDLPLGLEGLRALPHRLEIVAEDGGVLWVDDSISTTPESTLAALEAFSGRAVVLIAGGQDRSQRYVDLGRELASRDAVVLGLPVTGSRLVAAARDAGIAADRAIEVTDMQAAVERAREAAGPGSVVLLSPAAPSYNAYRNFEERGADFRSRISS